MAKDDKLTFLEQLSNALAGQSATSGAKALGEGIGYGYGGGALSDIPDVMREAIEEHKQRTASQSNNQQDAAEVAAGLAAMSNPYSAVGHAMDFVGAVPDMIKYKLSDDEAPIGMITQGGLKRRLAKGGAAADFAMANQLERAKANIKERGLLQEEPNAFFPLSSKSAKWGPGEGKFQAVKDYKSKAYDLAKKTRNTVNVGMGKNDKETIIYGDPHDLGVEFSHTEGLADQYRNKGYGKQIYQNMADVYGGGISHSNSTSQAARKVYKRLGGIDTGIPSHGGTRQALPTRAMKDDPETMAAFQKKIDEYALPLGGKGKLPPIEVEDTGLGGKREYLARKPDTNFSEYGATPSDAIENLRANLPEAMRQNLPRQRQQSSTYSTFSRLEQNEGYELQKVVEQLDNVLIDQGRPQTVFSKQQILEIFGSGSNFSDVMRESGYKTIFNPKQNSFEVSLDNR